MDYSLSYTRYPSVLKRYTDASWISNTEDNSSTSGWLFLLGRGAISFASKKQTCIIRSAMESEFVALAATIADEVHFVFSEWLFMDSEFCLQPLGDSATRKSVFDSLASGCIHVIFDPFTAYYQYPWHFPPDHTKYLIFIDKKDMKDMKVNVVEILMKVTLKKKNDMTSYIAYELMPKLVCGNQKAKFDLFQDAFSNTINTLIERHEGDFAFKEAWYHLSDEYPIKYEGERLPPPIVSDLNGDGKKEVLFATHDAKIQ
ncbi:xyloglucan-specific galacturonosyltransferase 1-like protein, partial [Tanacetum coccineum]